MWSVGVVNVKVGVGFQAATSHHLGQNFSKMFEIDFEHPEKVTHTPSHPHTLTPLHRKGSMSLPTRIPGVSPLEALAS